MNYIEELESILRERKAQLPEKSYTANLFRDGRDRILKKIGEEAGELIIAAKNNDKKEFLHESADLFFHLLVLCVNEGISFAEIVKELELRHR